MVHYIKSIVRYREYTWNFRNKKKVSMKWTYVLIAWALFCFVIGYYS